MIEASDEVHAYKLSGARLILNVTRRRLGSGLLSLGEREIYTCGLDEIEVNGKTYYQATTEPIEGVIHVSPRFRVTKPPIIFKQDPERDPQIDYKAYLYPLDYLRRNLGQRADS